MREMERLKVCFDIALEREMKQNEQKDEQDFHEGNNKNIPWVKLETISAIM